MIICKTKTLLSAFINKYLKQHTTIGFVPTMGALHEGHIALVKESKRKSEITVASIFVNPTQFNDISDFEKYPITIETDIELLEKAGCDILFLPSVQEIYEKGIHNVKHYDLDYLEEILEGKYRKGHFQGVCNVVENLLKMVQPNYLFLGQKDYQQCMVINRLIQLMNWQDIISLIYVPTVRENNGLAMSSRNKRLTENEKDNATIIFKSLNYIKENYMHQSFHNLIETCKQNLLNNGFHKIDYICICNANSLQIVDSYNENTKMVALIAAFIGEVRLIDNMLLN